MENLHVITLIKTTVSTSGVETKLSETYVTDDQQSGLNKIYKSLIREGYSEVSFRTYTKYNETVTVYDTPAIEL